jgi:hypothetical protein
VRETITPLLAPLAALQRLTVVACVQVQVARTAYCVLRPMPRLNTPQMRRVAYRKGRQA